MYQRGPTIELTIGDMALYETLRAALDQRSVVHILDKDWYVVSLSSETRSPIGYFVCKAELCELVKVG